ncbi:hypothetical protein NHQ30_011290 [Ciborinia camelliae]|nr:hypothetical protein NHQ30_011290 [Ciborinia camelliae]
MFQTLRSFVVHRAYRPPGARGQATPSHFKREDEGGSDKDIVSDGLTEYFDSKDISDNFFGFPLEIWVDEGNVPSEVNQGFEFQTGNAIDILQRILENLRPALGTDSRLLVVELVQNDGESSSDSWHGGTCIKARLAVSGMHACMHAGQGMAGQGGS